MGFGLTVRAKRTDQNIGLNDFIAFEVNRHDQVFRHACLPLGNNDCLGVSALP